MGCGVLAAANKPNQPTALNPGSPVSASVGSSGNTTERLLLVTPMPRNWPLRMYGDSTSTLSIAASSRPPSRSGITAPVPLYGTYSMSMPALRLSSSPASRCSEPGVEPAHVSLPGFALACAISSVMFLIGNVDCTTST